MSRPRDSLDLPDDALLAECEFHAYRASGPGGQKRNKTSSAVRLHHRPSGVIVVAVESRSQHENRARALSRLREALAIAFRRPPPASITWPAHAAVRDGRLQVSTRNPAWPGVLALLLDALAADGGRVSEAAARLGITSSNLTALLERCPKALAEANSIRAAAGMRPLR